MPQHVKLWCMAWILLSSSNLSSSFSRLSRLGTWRPPYWVLVKLLQDLSTDGWRSTDIIRWFNKTTGRPHFPVNHNWFVWFSSQRTFVPSSNTMTSPCRCWERWSPIDIAQAYIFATDSWDVRSSIKYFQEISPEWSSSPFHYPHDWRSLLPQTLFWLEATRVWNGRLSLCSITRLGQAYATNCFTSMQYSFFPNTTGLVFHINGWWAQFW